MLNASDESSWIELNAQALRENIATFRGVLTDSLPESGIARLGVVLKANAYGHGLAQVLSVVHPLVDIIHVISVNDALFIREQERKEGWPQRRVLVIGAISEREFVRLAQAEVEVTISDSTAQKALQPLKASGLKVNAHVHVDTGLSREGFFPLELGQELAYLKDNDCPYNVRGVLSHFANTEDVTDQHYAAHQLREFDAGVAELCKLLAVPEKSLERHIAASAATLVLPPSRADFVRVGIGLYGFWPSSETRISARLVSAKVQELKPVLAWRCRSQIVKNLSAGSYVGYGCTYRCERDMRIAVFPVGYFDGYPRLLSGRAHVLVNGHRAPVIGRVMMNHIVVDVSAMTGDESEVLATLLGRDGNEIISSEMFAGWCQTIHYEVVARLGSHLRRVVLET
ncbi:MAG: alanine racemase [Pseudomonadota bacterium]